MDKDLVFTNPHENSSPNKSSIKGTCKFSKNKQCKSSKFRKFNSDDMVLQNYLINYHPDCKTICNKCYLTDKLIIKQLEKQEQLKNVEIIQGRESKKRKVKSIVENVALNENVPKKKKFIIITDNIILEKVLEISNTKCCNKQLIYKVEFSYVEFHCKSCFIKFKILLNEFNKFNSNLTLKNVYAACYVNGVHYVSTKFYQILNILGIPTPHINTIRDWENQISKILWNESQIDIASREPGFYLSIDGHWKESQKHSKRSPVNQLTALNENHFIVDLIIAHISEIKEYNKL